MSCALPRARKLSLPADDGKDPAAKALGKKGGGGHDQVARGFGQKD
jgi:hypothetical protein